MTDKVEKKQDKLTFILIGIAVGVLYTIMNYIKYAYFSAHISEMSMAAVVNFMIVIVILFLVAQLSIKKNEGVFDFKKCFQAVFLVILVYEMGNVLMNYIYPFYINPQFMEEFHARNVVALVEINKNMDEESRKAILDNIKNMKETAPKDLMIIYLKEVIFSSVFGFIIVFISKLLNRSHTPHIVNHSSQQETIS